MSLTKKEKQLIREKKLKRRTNRKKRRMTTLIRQRNRDAKRQLQTLYV